MTSQLLPSYRRYVNGVPQPIGRKSLRLREKYIILLVFATFGIVCFGAFFFLPDLRDRVAIMEVRKQLQIAGNDIFNPELNHAQHGEVDVHLQEDQKRLGGKIAADREMMKRMEDLSQKLNLPTKDTLIVKNEIENDKQKLLADQKVNEMEIQKQEQAKVIQTVHKEHEGGAGTRGGEPSDPDVKQKRDKIKEVM